MYSSALKIEKNSLEKVLKISSPLNKCSFSFLNHDYTEEDE